MLDVLQRTVVLTVRNGTLKKGTTSNNCFLGSLLSVVLGSHVLFPSQIRLSEALYDILCLLE